MTIQAARGMLILLMILCLTTLAGATPAEDVERGTSIQITQLDFTINGSYQVSDIFLPKAPNTLDTFIDARAFGIAVDWRIPLRGTRSGNTITWSFDVSPSPAVDIGWPNTIVRIRGSLVARATLLPSTADPRCAGLPCPYTVWLMGLPESEAIVTVSTAFIPHDHRVENIRFAGLGGLPRARLQQFVLNRRGRFCSRAVETYVSGRVVTTLRAPAGGAWISISSSDPLRARVSGVTIREGEQSAPFGIYVAPNWSGELVLTASAGGVTQPIALTVEPPSVCTLGQDFSISTSIGACVECFRVSWINNAGDIFGELDGEQVFQRRDWKKPRPLREVFQLSEDQINPYKLNNQGQLFGSLVAKNRKVAFFADMAIDAKPISFPIVFEDTDIAGANDLGVVVGTRSSKTGPIAFYSNGREQVDIPIKTEWSRAVAVNNREEVLGNFVDGKRTRPFVFYQGKVEPIEIANGNSTATALSEAGHVVGFWSANGQTLGFLARRSPKGGWDTIEIGGMPGFDEILPAAVNSFGVVVGTARSKQGSTTAFLYSPKTGIINLNKALNSDLSAVAGAMNNPKILAALTINDANEVVVVGELNGKQVQFILQLNTGSRGKEVIQ